MAATDFFTEEEVTRLVHGFYVGVREDDLLGLIFNHHLADWDQHRAKPADFCSDISRGTMRFSRAPMSVYITLPDLNAGLFQRWLP